MDELEITSEGEKLLVKGTKGEQAPERKYLYQALPSAALNVPSSWPIM